MDWYGADRLQPFYKNIPTLLSFDVKSSGRLVPCPDIYLKLDGSTVLQPSTKPPTLSRDLSDFSKTRVRLGGTTVNFRLPETTASAMDFELIVRDSNGIETTLAQRHIEFVDHPWKRPLRVAVIPIGVEYNFSSTPPPPAAPMSRFLQYALPSMFPIPHGKLQVDLKSPEWMETNLGLLSNLPGIAALAAKLSLWYVDALAKPKYDLVVAVMPPGSIKILSSEINYFLHLTEPASGVNYGYGEKFWLSTPRVLFVDAETPAAVIHELGHAAGLYRDTEQYDMPEYKKTEGMPLHGFSSAALDEQLGNVLNGFPASGMVHFANTNMTWYKKEYQWIDVMGLPETQIWPSTGTYNSVMGFFNGLLATTNAPSANSSIGSAAFTPLEPETDSELSSRSGVNAALRKTPKDLGGPTITFAGIAVQPEGQNTDLTSTLNSAMEASQLPYVAPQLVPASNWYQYGLLRFYDSTGSVLEDHDFNLPMVFNEATWWAGSLPLPSGCVRYSLFGHRGSDDMLKTTWQRAGNLSVQIDRSFLPNPVGSTLELVWQVSADDPQPDSHLTSQALVSTNNGANWELVGKATEQSYLSVPTDSLPKTDSLAVRVVVSDGFTSAVDTVLNLSIGDRPPTLAISEPRDGDVALTNTIWNLLARASDLEDGELKVAWTSSRDGALTSPAELTSGSHRLTCSVTDSAGHTVQTNLNVLVVSTPSSTDLCLDSFTLLGVNREISQSWGTASGAIVAFETNVLECVVRNSGIQTTGVVTMTITQPDGQEIVLSSSTVEFAPFDYQRISFPFVPQSYGAYTLAVLVEPQDRVDRTPENNVGAVRTFTYAPTLYVNSASARQEFVFLWNRYEYPYPPPGGTIIPTALNESVYLYNGGYVPLIISNATLTCGSDFYGADHFRIYPVAQFPVTVQPGEEVQIGLQFYGKTVAPESTGLRVLSNDPRRPDFEIPVHGWVYPPGNEDWRDSDYDGLPSFLESAVGLDPTKADTDGDGLIDGLEDRNVNGIREAWETSALDADTDDDGLSDGEEDLNHNGGRDGHETSAFLADSDGDGISDADEARCRTDGLNAADYLWLGQPAATSAEFELQWNSRRSVQYQIQFSDDMFHWSLAPSGSGQDEQATQSSQVDGLLNYRASRSGDLRFYRLSVPQSD